jgi:hypothetical protein
MLRKILIIGRDLAVGWSDGRTDGLHGYDVQLCEDPAVAVSSPVSGVVVGVNPILAERPQFLASDLCGEGWTACICTTRHEEMANCKPRCLVLVNADAHSAEEQTRKLTASGCQVEAAPNLGT